MIKKFLIFFFGLLLILFLWQYKLVLYGIGQGKGQLEILLNTQAVEEVLSDPNIPDTTKQKLRLIQEVRKFAFDSLGINSSKNYTTIYDQKGKPSLWVVTASERFALKAKEWTFPFLGNVSYKGFFDYDKALKEEAKLKEKGWDTYIGIVGGWSTLGWFKDPILSNMLFRSKGDVVNLIIHELTHTTLFVKDSVEFNENLATFIGNKGTELFLKRYYGEDSDEYIRYIKDEEDFQRFSTHILAGADRLDSLYSTFSYLKGLAFRQKSKDDLIKKIVVTADTLTLNDPERYSHYFNNFTPNNAFFMSFLRYRSRLDNFESEFLNQYNSNLKKYLEHMKEKYPSL